MVSSFRLDRPGEVDLVVQPDLDADDADQTVERRGHATEDTGGDGEDDGTDLR
jgi:hypothetical protein